MDATVDKDTLKKALTMQPPKVECVCERGLAKAELLSNGICRYYQKGTFIRAFYSEGKTADGQVIRTKDASLEGYSCEEGTDKLGAYHRMTARYCHGALRLHQVVTAYDGGELTVQVKLHDTRGKTATRFLAPVVTPYPTWDERPLFLSLDQKMLVVPYDNDMWSRYESAVPACGRESYDVTALYDERTQEGFVLGALDFSVWKNAIRWLHNDARSIQAYCGAAGTGTHDVCPHGLVCGEWVESSRFVMFWCDSIRDGMEHYGDLYAALVPPRPWRKGSVPFGWNSYSAVGQGLQLSHWEQAGEFIRTALPNFCGEPGETFINLDGALGLDEQKIRQIIEELHKKGQKAGWYAIPCNWFAALGDFPARGTNVTMKDLFLRDDAGALLPAIDGSQPLDVTHPEWEKMARATIRHLIDLGVDYIKIDFLSHGSVEGAHYRPEFTGRMALNYAYSVLSEEIDRAGREIFVSLSIAPLFPTFLGHSRRCCCDAFGHHEDVRYVLNALNFAWWTNHRLYTFNDPDHVSLCHSVVDGRGVTTENEARARYYSAVISGTVMMLSDNYGPVGDDAIIRQARSRAEKIANCAAINAVARLGQAFRPVYLCDGTTPFYTLCHEGRRYAAVFNFENATKTLSFAAADGGLPEHGIARNLETGAEMTYSEQVCVELAPWDAVILEILEEKKYENA